MRLLITGATGFVGKAFTKYVSSQGYDVALASRENFSEKSKNVDHFVVGDLSETTNWEDALKQVDVVVHCAARAHILDDVDEPLAAFRKANTAGTLNLARQAANAGVNRFIFLSSIAVNGNKNCAPFTETDICCPQGPYAVSKHEAEQGMWTISKETEMDLVIIRPPLVYGGKAPGNFGKVLGWAKKPVPLPFGAIRNRRSFVALDNLVDFIGRCVCHPRAANEVFLISDGDDLSTTEFLKGVANAFGRQSLLLPVPVVWMAGLAKLIGKAGVANSLFGSLQVDSSKARKLLGWTPVTSMDAQLKKIVRDYLNEKSI